MPWCCTLDCRSKRSFKKMDQPCGCRNRPSIKLYVKAGRHSWRSYLHMVLICALDLYMSCCCSTSVEGPEAKTTETQILEVLGQWLYREFAGPAPFGRLTIAKRTHPACFHFCHVYQKKQEDNMSSSYPNTQCRQQQKRNTQWFPLSLWGCSSSSHHVLLFLAVSQKQFLLPPLGQEPSMLSNESKKPAMFRPGRATDWLRCHEIEIR